MKINKIKYEKIGLSYSFYFQKLFKLKIKKNKNRSHNSESKELNLFNNISEIKKVKDNQNNNKEMKLEKKKYLFTKKNTFNKNFICKKLSIKNNSTINLFKKNYNVFGDSHQKLRKTIVNFNINKNISRNKKK